MSTDNLEPIRRVFRNAGLYHHASDDLLCQELAAVAAPQPQAEPVGEWVMVPREALERWRDAFAEELGAWDIDPPLHHVKTSHDEIDAMLTAPLGAAAPPRPQASAEDVRRVGEYMVVCLDEEAHAAWQRIRASLGVANG